MRSGSAPLPLPLPGAGARPAPRPASAISTPMIGWMPASAQAVANSRAPNRLPLSVIATAGIASARHSCDQLLDLDRPGRQRIGRVGAQMDEIGERHGDRPTSQCPCSIASMRPAAKAPASRGLGNGGLAAARRCRPAPPLGRSAPTQPGVSRPSSSATMRSRRRARSRLWVAISAARPLRADDLDQGRHDARRRWCGRGCRSARRPAGSSGRWPARGRSRRAAARRPTAAPGGG